jgi:hypothetical protein
MQTEAYIRRLMEQRDQPKQAFRTCTAMLHMADTRTAAAMEQTAFQALQQMHA